MLEVSLPNNNPGNNSKFLIFWFYSQEVIVGEDIQVGIYFIVYIQEGRSFLVPILHE